MKECPVCKAKSFDDMEVCFSCMHQFAKEGAPAIAEAGPAVLPGGGDRLQPAGGGRMSGRKALRRLGGTATSSRLSHEPAYRGERQAFELSANYKLIVSIVPMEEGLRSPEAHPQSQKDASSSEEAAACELTGILPAVLA